MKMRVGVFFGGKSVEHEISVISAMQSIAALDTEKYDIVPIYISKDTKMYTGDVGVAGKIESYKDIPSLIKRLTRVILVNDEGTVKLIKYPTPMLSKGEVGRIDIALPVVHGTNVEDGNLQGYFHSLGIPYCGCDTLSSALGMDKLAQKAVMRFHGLPVLDCICKTALDYTKDKDSVIEAVEALGYPVIVKPVNLGSSVGISKASDRESLEDALDNAFMYADKVLCEHAIENLREINCSVLGDTDSAKASVCEEPLGSGELLSFDLKYVKNGGGKGAKSAESDNNKRGMANLSRKCPAEIPEELSEKIRSYAITVFKCLGCCGVSRIDFLLDSDTMNVYVNEINTIPGSLAFYLWEATGVPFSELLDEVINLAFKRERRKRELTYSFDTNVLSGAAIPTGKK